jgi:uncharacterized membrane protein YbaN (DUF454 family)
LLYANSLKKNTKTLQTVIARTKYFYEDIRDYNNRSKAVEVLLQEYA